MQNLSTCLWFDHQAEAAANFYVGIFPNSRVLDIKRYLPGGPGPAGAVMTVRFVLDGVEHVGLNGGPHFSFSPAVSLIAYCDSQAQVDRLWQQLGEGGQESQCGWLSDKFGVSWQIVPRQLLALLDSPDVQASQRAMAAMMTMRKLDIAAFERAYKNA